jgi:hypothetical protein
MASTSRLTDLRNPPLPPVAAGNGDRQRAVRPHGWQLATNAFRRRFDRVALGFWLGGVVLGTGGCVLGACMHSRHPVGVAAGVIWWGIYLGCFGASLGALLGLWAERTTASPPWRADADITVGTAPPGSPWSLPPAPEAVGREGTFTPTLVITKWPRYLPMPTGLEGVADKAGRSVR